MATKAEQMSREEIQRLLDEEVESVYFLVPLVEGADPTPVPSTIGEVEDVLNFATERAATMFYAAHDKDDRSLYLGRER